MADSPVFDRACSELEQRTSLDRLAARGTIRIALKSAGLDVAGVTAAQMGVVLRRVLPAELATRGIEDAVAVCAAIANLLAGMSFEVAQDRAAEAAATIARFGS
jgi:hypothetical protein